jgi:hypothetical protein
MYSKALLAAAALVASASAFSPAALPMGLRQRSATTRYYLRMGLVVRAWAAVVRRRCGESRSRRAATGMGPRGWNILCRVLRASLRVRCRALLAVRRTALRTMLLAPGTFHPLSVHWAAFPREGLECLLTGWRGWCARIRSLRMGADRQAPGPQGRGPFTPDDAFVLPDGRKYVPGDACSDDIYGERLQLCCMSKQGCPRVTQRHTAPA